MKPRRQPPDSGDLNTLLRHPRGYAEHMMHRGGVPPTLLADTPEDVIVFVPDSMPDQAAKDRFANAGRLLAVGYQATAVATILESWATFAKRPGQPLPKTPPANSPDREEVVVITAESRESKAQQFLFIQRDSRGKFTGFGTSVVPQLDGIEGRFEQMMPPRQPSEKDSEMARQLLAVMGIVPANRGFNPEWN